MQCQPSSDGFGNDFAVASIAATFCLAVLMAPAVLGQPETQSGVMRIVPPPAGMPGPGNIDDVRTRLYVSVEKQARHLLSKVHPWKEDGKLLLVTDSKSDEHWIRPNTGTVLGFCFLHHFGSYDESVVGVSREELLNETIVPMMRYLTATHLTGGRPTSDGKCWGSQWQSAHWAHMLGRGAWWIWDDLPADVQDGVRKVMAHEADRIAATEPPHSVFGDTKAEENAWNSQVLSVAAVLMPEDPRRPKWEQAYQRWALSAFLRPADESSNQIVDGRPLSEQFTGANIHDDFTLENHGRVHPDYMTTFLLSAGCAVDYAMSGRKPPESAFHNVAGVYENLKWFSLPSGGFVYPNGQDWELLRDPEWTYLHLFMAAQGNDPDAWGLMLPCLATQDRMQARSQSGTVYLDEEFFFASTLSDQLYYGAMAWLALEYRGAIVDKPTEKWGVLRLDSGKLILNRTRTAVHTFSWGDNLMAQVIPLRLDRVTSPHPRSGIGYIRIKGEKEALPVSIHRVDVTNDAEGFEVALEADHGKGLVRAFLVFRSMPDGTWWMSEKLQSLDKLNTAEVATGLVGVLNNPEWVYERGEREIVLGGQTRVVKSGQGTVFKAGGATEVDIDGVMRIRGPKPLNVLYRGAKKAERARFTDEVYLNHMDGPKEWEAGEVISEYEATIHCGGV